MSRRSRWAATLALVAGAAASVLLDAPSPSRSLFLAASAQDTALPAAPGADVVAGRCIICHGLELVTQQRQGPEGWAVIVDRMISYGAPIPPEDRQTILDYLLKHFRDPGGR